MFIYRQRVSEESAHKSIDSFKYLALAHARRERDP